LMCLDCAKALEYLHLFKAQGLGINQAQAFRCSTRTIPSDVTSTLVQPR
jgi:hypothetical protein